MIASTTFKGWIDLEEWWDNPNRSTPTDRRRILKKARVTGEGYAMWESFSRSEKVRIFHAANRLIDYPQSE